MTDAGGIENILFEAIRKVLADIQQRSTEAMKALEQHDYLIVLGALAGLDEQMRFLIVRLMVLREIKEFQKQKSEPRRKS